MKRKKERKNKKVAKVIKKKYRYKIDNKYQKAKIKNLEQSLEFQEYNVKEKIDVLVWVLSETDAKMELSVQKTLREVPVNKI